MAANLRFQRQFELRRRVRIGVERLESRRLLAVASTPWALISSSSSGATAGYVTSLASSPARPIQAIQTAGIRSTMAGAAGFQIEVVFPDSTLTASQQQAFTDAAARWSQVIVGDLPDVTANGVTIDDLQIEASAPYIDGPSGILGQAGPTATRTGPRGLPYQGVMQFDSADVATMVSQGTFRDVILHEMGHVLGLGTLWSRFGLLRGAGTADPQFTGANAAREYATLAGTAATSVPVENTGGAGTRDGHWRESVFDTELMTGWAERPGVAMPISRVTVGQYQDLGYTVDYAAADPYQLPGTSRTVTVGDVTVTEGNAGTSQATLTFALSSAATTAVTFQYSTRDGTATVADNDYVAATGTVSFAAGETQKTVSFTINGDTKVESDEAFTVALSNAVGATLGRQSATVTIRNDDTSPTPTPSPAPTPSLPTLSVADVSVVEGNSGTRSATFTVTLSSVSQSTVTVQYATSDGTATTADSDYVPTSGVLTFAPGQTSKTVAVTIVGDTKVEADEAFTFVLSSPTNATLGRATAIGTITNDDSGGGPAPTPSGPSVSVADVSVVEGNSGTTFANFVITLSAAAIQPVLVRYTTADRTATVFDRDYMAAVGSVAFAVGETSKTISVAVMGDTRVEANETFSFTISSVIGATIARSAAVGTITNDDTAASTGISIADSQVTEGNSGLSLISFVISLSSPASDPVTVKFRTVAGSATAGADFAAAAGEVRFARGGVRQMVNVWVQGDRAVEQNETFTVELYGATGATISRGVATGTILNDDVTAVQAAFAQLAGGVSSTSQRQASAAR